MSISLNYKIRLKKFCYLHLNINIYSKKVHSPFQLNIHYCNILILFFVCMSEIYIINLHEILSDKYIALRLHVTITNISGIC